MKNSPAPNSKTRKHLETLRRRRDRLEMRVASYDVSGDPHPTTSVAVYGPSEARARR